MQADGLSPNNCPAKISQTTEGDVSGPPSPPTSPPKSRIRPGIIDELFADPPLYVEERPLNGSKIAPLFPHESMDDSFNKNSEARKETPGASEKSCAPIHSTSTAGTRSLSKPTTGVHGRATTFASILHQQNPRLLFRETMTENAKYYRLARHPRTSLKYVNTDKSASAPHPASISKAPKPPRQPTTSPKKPGYPANRIVKPTQRPTKNGILLRAPIPAPGEFSASIIKKSSNRDFERYPDVSPSVDLLGNRSDAFTFTRWMGKPLDLSSDPNRHMLHPSELKAAEALRLECDRWLVTKRMIFLGALECYRAGKEFKKTDAQKATVIDVNKASKIWEAFNSVGWFAPQHFARFLR